MSDVCSPPPNHLPHPRPTLQRGLGLLARGPSVGAGTAWLLACVLSLLGAWQAHALGRRDALESALRIERSAAARKQAAVSLGELGDTDATRALIMAMLGDRDATVRAACAGALAALADPTSLSALRAATRDDSEVVRRQASTAVSRLSPATRSTSGRRTTIVMGRAGSKAKSGTLPDIERVLRDAVIKQLQGQDEIDLVENLTVGERAGVGYTLDTSVTRLSRATTQDGELAVSCYVSMIIAALPGRNVVSMAQGDATVIGPRGPSTKPTKQFLESLETQSIEEAVRSAMESLHRYLRTQGAR